MIAGTLLVLESPTEDPLEDYLNGVGYPALSVERTQQGLDGTPIQQGAAAGRIDTVKQDISAGNYQDSEGVFVDVDRVESRTKVATDWVADVTDSGVILVESMEGSDPAFPVGLFWDQAGSEPVPQSIDVAEMFRAWSQEDVLGSVEMTTSEDEDDGVSIDWGDAASEENTPTIGVGFSRPWDGTAIRGVVYESGYVALYSAGTASKAVRFVADELLPYASEPEESDDEQTTLEEATGGDVRECIKCGSSEEDITIVELLEEDVCLTCKSGWDEDRWSMEEVRGDE